MPNHILRLGWQCLQEQALQSDNKGKFRIDQPDMLQMSVSDANAPFEIPQKHRAASLKLQTIRLRGL
jgi:hypothetical protein